MSVQTRIRALAAIFAVTTGALVLIATPAQAASSGRSDDACWINADTGVTRCFVDDDTLQDAVAASGAVLVEEGTAARLPAGILATYVLARLYDGTSYTGASATVTSSNSAICTTGPGVTGNLPSFNDRTSSFHSYLGCVTRLFANNGQSGAWYGYATDAPTVGGLDNLASSFSIV